MLILLMEVFTQAAALAGHLKYDSHVTFSSRRQLPAAAVDQPPVVDFQRRFEPRRNLVLNVNVEDRFVPGSKPLSRLRATARGWH